MKSAMSTAIQTHKMTIHEIYASLIYEMAVMMSCMSCSIFFHNTEISISHSSSVVFPRRTKNKLGQSFVKAPSRISIFISRGIFHDH